MKDVLFNRAKLVREATRSGKGVGDGSTRFGLPGDGDYSKSKEYYVPYEIAFVSHAGFLETMLKKELGGGKSIILCPHHKLLSMHRLLN